MLIPRCTPLFPFILKSLDTVPLLAGDFQWAYRMTRMTSRLSEGQPPDMHRVRCRRPKQFLLQSLVCRSSLDRALTFRPAAAAGSRFGQCAILHAFALTPLKTPLVRHPSCAASGALSSACLLCVWITPRRNELCSESYPCPVVLMGSD